MTHITWNDAEAFTKKLNKLTGLPFSLPTEAQWEYAAAGGESYPYAGSDNIRDVAYYASNANERLHPVGEKRENGFDLYDMSGNAAEWCTDWMSRYENTRGTDPQGPAENPGHHKKIVRGGSYLPTNVIWTFAIAAYRLTIHQNHISDFVWYLILFNNTMNAK